MSKKTVTYVVKFFRNGKLLSGEIHKTFEEAASSAYEHLADKVSAESCAHFEQLLQSWENEEMSLVFDDTEYSLILERYVAQRLPNEKNDCVIIPFRKNENSKAE